ncbi:ubiquitin recognition factor in ER-associated degradation protein 1-like [Oppia nitens]|uniref:ubiquitin recognition factor in ER-associated degradation protein 1-like n=1 Tax=Oppia nitens TaxID=1686743 RepID=UPI0023DCA7D9|nr:ubiquitin recognition factor in ER-associated degradation protein 1-like [Oppia nitens]
MRNVYHLLGINRRQYVNYFRCHSMTRSATGRQDIEKGGKIILPITSLVALNWMEISCPWMFRLTNILTNRITHCGVLEFLSDEGQAILPDWMMRNMCIENESMIMIENVVLPMATFARFQPQSSDFFDIPDYRTVLENNLKQLACLTTGDILDINFDDMTYGLSVIETQPMKAVYIVDCNLMFDIENPIKTEISKKSLGYRLDGRKVIYNENSDNEPIPKARGIPNDDYKLGSIRFIRTSHTITNNNNQINNIKKFEAFEGVGHQL